jgi:signal transduction histidine kinase
MHRFAEQFCRVIAQRCDVQSLLSEILDGREDFDNRVRRASHASKTPLQAAVSTVELLESPDNHGTLEQYRKELRAVRHLIHRAAMELTENLIGSTEPRKVLDLRALVASLAEEMRPIAMRREITLRYDRPTLRVPVAVSELEIRTALRNLLDNAVKYSYSPQEVRIVLDICGTTARLAIKNYGLGIDEGKLTEIFELGVRGNVADHKAERAGHVRGGTGLGLFLALTDIEAHAGTLDLSSVPAAAARPSEPLHRYLTTATVTLPISAEERDE